MIPPVVTLCRWMITASDVSTPMIPASSLRYALCSDLDPVLQFWPENARVVSLCAVITNAEVPLSVNGSKDPSLTARAVLSLIDWAIAEQLSVGILYLSSKMRSLEIDRLKAASILIGSIEYGSSGMGGGGLTVGTDLFSMNKLSLS